MEHEIEVLFKTFMPEKYEKTKISDLLSNPDYGRYFISKLRKKYSTRETEGVSIVTCTNKPHCMENIFQNYQNQSWEEKELIVILNNDGMDIPAWKRIARCYKNVHLYQLPQEMSLGRCYNFSVNKAQYGYIATFDDDDYYAPNYLTDLMHAFQYTDADIVGKATYFVYLEEKQILALRNPYQEYTYLYEGSFLDGGKKIVKRKVFDQVQFKDVSNLEDVFFCQDCMRKGFKIFSADKYNLTYIRQPNKAHHTWKEEDDKILSWGCLILSHTDDYKTMVTL